MSQKTIFLVLVAISTASLLFYWRQHPGTMEAFSCSVLPLGLWHRSMSAAACLTIGTGKPKHTNVVFLKTHKTASSTVQNILFRFAERHNLTVALPVPQCEHQFCYPYPFSVHFVHENTTPPDIFTNHARFNVTEMRRLMPSGTRYITILREPVAMFESLFSYYGMECQSFRKVPNASLENFLSQPQFYYRPKHMNSMYARNTVTFDLGGDKDRPPGDKEYMRRFIAQVEDVFSLVMITEYFDESLVLLRRLLNWDIEDLLYLKLNMRAQESHKPLQGTTLPAKIRAWNWLDAALYDYFNASLWRQLDQLGRACLEREVKLLHEARDRMMHECFGKTMPQVRAAGQIRHKELQPWQPKGKVTMVGYDLPVTTPGFQWLGTGGEKGKEKGGGGRGEKRGKDKKEGKGAGGGITKDLCLKMMMPEVQYSKLLLRSQVPTGTHTGSASRHPTIIPFWL